MKKKILIIDNEKSIIFILKNTLNKEFDIITAYNGKEALYIMQSGNLPDLIICDINMPIMNGYEFIKNVKCSGFFGDIPIITLSGEQESESRIKCFDMGVVDFIIKPFNPLEVIARINRIFKCKNVIS